MTFNTGNPVPSTDARDLYDNAQNLDKFSNGDDPEYQDRLGRPRKSLAGIRAEVTEALSRLGYQVRGDYAAGLVIQNYGEVFRKDGEFYRAVASLNLPYVLTGVWASESANFVSVGDAVLRSALGSTTDALSGAELIGLLGGGTVARALQFVTPEMFGQFSADTLIQAIDTNKAVMLSASNTTVALQTTLQVQKFLAALDRLIIFGSQLTVTLPAGQHSIASTVLVRSQNNAKIKLLGTVQHETTITSISSVTGAAGNWSVTANVANAAGIAVGDVVCIRGVTPGVQAPGTYTGRPPIGALQMQFFQNGELSLSGTVGSLSKAVLPDFVSSGDFLIADGKVKRMLTITASGFTVDAANAPPIAYSGKQYWYTMRPSAAGTVTVSGNTVTGSSTTFTQRVNAGDLIAFQGHGLRKIASVDSDTQLTLTATHPDIGTATAWGVITPGELHEGAWVVTAVSGNQVTWTNTARTPYGPPVKLVNGGNVYAMKTNLVFNGASGFVVDGGILEIDRLGLRGSGGSATVGIDLRGESGERTGQARLGQRVGISGFHYGAWLSSGAMLQATLTHWGGQLTRGINAAGGEARIGSASVAGTSGIGVFIGEGAYVRMSDTRVHGCSLQGVRMEVGGSVWADFAVIGHNVADNILAVGGVNIHFVGTRCFASGGSGFTGQNGGFGRATGITMLGNGYRGFNAYNGQIEANQAIIMGSVDSAAVFSRGIYSVEEAGIGYNDRGIYALQMANVSASGNTQLIGHNGVGITSSARSTVYAPAAGFSSNGTSAQAVTGGLIVVKGQAGGASFSPALNVAAADGSLITDA